MRRHFRYLRFKTFPMTPRTPQCEVFYPLLSSSEHSGVPEDSQPPTFPSVGLHPHTWPKWGCDTFGATTSHGQTRIHKIHHGPDLGETTTFPLIVYFVPLHETHSQMAFCPRTPKWESRNCQSWDYRDFGAHNFVCRPLIEMRS
jgi:hypothetical protein